MACALLSQSVMKPRTDLAESGDAAVLDQESKTDQAETSSCERAPALRSSQELASHRADAPGQPERWLTIERGASDPVQATATMTQIATRHGTRGPGSAGAAVAQEQKQPIYARPLTLDEVIKQTLIRSLRETAGNRRRTASVLGISRSTLYRMLARYGIGDIGRGATSRKSRRDSSVPPASTA